MLAPPSHLLRRRLAPVRSASRTRSQHIPRLPRPHFESVANGGERPRARRPSEPTYVYMKHALAVHRAPAVRRIQWVLKPGGNSWCA